MVTRRRTGLTTREIALIKAMLRLGKRAGFDHAVIQSYFTRPDRTMNPARIYDIIDGKLGNHVPSATETELHDFLSRFATLPTADEQVQSSFPLLPAPAYIGVLEGRIRLLPRDAVIAEEAADYDFREQLLQEQCRLAAKLAESWHRFQVDRRLKEGVEEYSRIAGSNHRSLNIFSLDTEFTAVNKALGPDKEGLGQSGEVLWEKFTQNHVVLCNLYPEMQKYLAALASMRPDATLPDNYASQITKELLSEDAYQFVEPEVPTLIQDRLNQDTSDDPEANRKRTYDVTALIGRTSALLHSIYRHLPHAGAAANAVHTLWSRIWVPLRELLRAQGYL